MQKNLPWVLLQDGSGRNRRQQTSDWPLRPPPNCTGSFKTHPRSFATCSCSCLLGSGDNPWIVSNERVLYRMAFRPAFFMQFPQKSMVIWKISEITKGIRFAMLFFFFTKRKRRSKSMIENQGKFMAFGGDCRQWRQHRELCQTLGYSPS